MSNPVESNIAFSLLNIHKIITRGLEVSIESVRDALLHGFQDEGRKKGLFNYIRALVSVLNSHHHTEDEIAFPFFQDKLPGAPFDKLVEEHQVMVQILEEVRQALEKCEGNEQLGTSLRDLEKGLTSLNAAWHPHIQLETDEFISKADAILPVEEQLRLVRLFAEHGQKLAVPPFLTVPFLLFNLSPDDRQLFSQGMPPEVLQNLVPIVWKAQWEDMLPYLLE